MNEVENMRKVEQSATVASISVSNENGHNTKQKQHVRTHTCGRARARVCVCVCVKQAHGKHKRVREHASSSFCVGSSKTRSNNKPKQRVQHETPQPTNKYTAGRRFSLGGRGSERSKHIAAQSIGEDRTREGTNERGTSTTNGTRRSFKKCGKARIDAIKVVNCRLAQFTVQGDRTAIDSWNCESRGKQTI